MDTFYIKTNRGYPIQDINELFVQNNTNMFISNPYMMNPRSMVRTSKMLPYINSPSFVNNGKGCSRNSNDDLVSSLPSTRINIPSTSFREFY